MMAQSRIYASQLPGLPFLGRCGIDIGGHALDRAIIMREQDYHSTIGGGIP
jgi:hypothetical protein